MWRGCRPTILCKLCCLAICLFFSNHYLHAKHSKGKHNVAATLAKSWPDSSCIPPTRYVEETRRWTFIFIALLSSLNALIARFLPQNFPNAPQNLAMSPPKINMATKPKPIQGSDVNVPQPSRTATFRPITPNRSHPTPTRRLVPVTVYIDPNYIEHLEAALLHLGEHAQLAIGVPHNESLDYGISQPPATNYQELAPCDRCNIPDEYSQFDEYLQFKELATSFSSLSMSTASVVTASTLTASASTTSFPTGSFPAQSAPVVSTSQVSPMKKKYYVVLVGKCAGVFYDKWYSSCFASVTGLLMSCHYRNNVRCLIRHVSDAQYKGFLTQQAAERFYAQGKARGMVRIVWDPGDDEKFSPMADAIQ